MTLAEHDAAVSSTIKDLQKTNDNDIKEVANLLFDLKAAITADPNLPNEAKTDALEQVKILGEAAQEPSVNVRGQVAKGAMRMLRGITTELPNAIQFVNACNKLLPQILSLLSLG